MPPFATLLPLLRDILFLRRGPQDLPYSPALLALLIGATLAVYAALSANLERVQLPRGAFSLLLQLGLTWTALNVADKSPRFVQTATALVGASIVLTLLAIPGYFGVDSLAEAPKELTQTQALAIMFLLLFQVWDIAITAHILRHALELKLRFGVLIAIVFLAVDAIASGVVFERAAT
ncbi:MAG TPA: hypothetical protein VFL14_01185 [Xanthomonadales bacterium]|nr:hypothetical protein [Xanthomonadales bacterium]